MEIFLYIFYAILCFIISSAVHELGHVLTGLREGFKFYLLIAGPFGFKREEDKIRFYIEKRISFWGGLGATIPRDEKEENFKKFGRVLLGGPIASLIFGTAWLPLAIIKDSIYLLLLSVTPISMGIVCLIPARNGAFYTDGGRWLRMHKNAKTRAVEIATWNITQSSVINGNYKRVNSDDIMILIKDEDTRTKYVGHYFAYNLYKDNGDMLSADKEKLELEGLKEKVPKQIVTLYCID